MSAFVVVHVTVNDPEKFKTYGQGAQPTVAAHGGEFILRGKVADVFQGEHPYKQAVVIKFPDQATAKGWYNSPEYQALIPNRNEAADMLFISFDEPPA